MGPPVDPVQSLDAPPASADVVIVGGGIIGASTALFLARQGVSTVLCEKGLIGAEQSSRNWGWCRRMGRDERELPLIVESLKLWDRMDELVGEDVGFRRSGIAYVCKDEADVAKHEAWLRRAGPYGLDSRISARRRIGRRCCPEPPDRCMQPFIRQATAVPSRSAPLPPLRVPLPAPARPSSPTAPSAASRRRPAACRRSSRKRARSPAAPP